MKLEYIALDKLVIARTNMRHGRASPDVSDLLPTIRKRGILQTLLVRPGDAPGHYEIVAGRRRYHAARIVAGEQRAAEAAEIAIDAPADAGATAGTGAATDGQDVASPVSCDALPCAILDDGDDAAAIEASLIENLARLDPDEVTQWQTFTRLVREGQGVEEIAATFGLPDLMVRRVLALGNLLPRIRTLYAADKIDRLTVRHLTLASKRQQRDWLALVDDASAHAPTGHQLKAWLFGGTSIPVRHALFDVAASGLAVVADLFGEDAYFADPAAFWTAQHAEIDARRAAFLEAGWSDAVVVPATQHFAAWEHEKMPKRKSGRVYLDVRSSGEVVIHEGYLTRAEAARIARKHGGDTDCAPAKTARPEITSALNTYVDLHRHAAVRAALTGHPGVALRLMVAHAIRRTHLWRVDPEPQAAPNDAVRESVETCVGETEFDVRRRAVLALLGYPADEPLVTGGHPDDGGLVGIFARLLDLSDADLLDVIAVVMGETLASGSLEVEAAALRIGVDMPRYWRADDAFLDAIRDKEVLVAMIGEVAGPEAALANAKETGKAMKAVIRDCLHGTNGRARVENWVPRWLAFPPSHYTARGGVGCVRAHGTAFAALTPTSDAGTSCADAGGSGAPPGADLPQPDEAAPDTRPAASCGLDDPCSPEEAEPACAGNQARLAA